MAGLGDMNVKIGADLSELLTKVEAAKAKLNQLTESQQQLKTSINDLNASLKINEIELGKTAVQLKKLVDSGKGATAEANNLRKAMSGLSANSLELNKNLSLAKTQLSATTTQLKVQNVALKEAETASSGFAKGATKLYSGLRTLANIIPGIGIGGLVALIAGPLVEALGDWLSLTDKVSESQKALSKIREEVSGQIATELAKTIQLKAVLESEHTTRLQKIAALKELKAINPDYFGQLDLEKGKVKGLQLAYDLWTASILRSVSAKVSQKGLEDAFKKRQDLVDKLRQDIQDSKADITKLTEFEIQDISRRFNIKGILDGAKLQIIAEIKQAEKEIREKTKEVAETIQDVFVPKPETGGGKEKIIKAAKETAKIYTETLQHALRELFEKGFQGPDDPFKALLNKGKITVVLDPSVQKALDKIAESVKAVAALQQKLQDTADLVNKVVGPAFDALFTSIVDGSGNAFQSFADALNQVIKKLIVALLKAVALGAIMALITGKPFNLGSIITGALKGFARGGEVKGPGSSKSDSIPARLSKGEFVIKADSVKKFGVDFFNKLNQGRSPNFFGGIPKFAAGGFVSANVISGAIGGGQQIFIAKSVIRGQDIVTTYQRASGTINRNS